MERHIRDYGWRTWLGALGTLLFPVLLVVEIVKSIGEGDAPIIGVMVWASIAVFLAYGAIRIPQVGLTFRESDLVAQGIFRRRVLRRVEISSATIVHAFMPIPRYHLCLETSAGKVFKVQLPGKYATEEQANSLVLLVSAWRDGGMDALPAESGPD